MPYNVDDIPRYWAWQGVLLCAVEYINKLLYNNYIINIIIIFQMNTKLMCQLKFQRFYIWK